MRHNLLIFSTFLLEVTAVLLVIAMGWSVWVNQGFRASFVPFPIALTMILYTLRKLLPGLASSVHSSFNAIFFWGILAATVVITLWLLFRL